MSEGTQAQIVPFDDESGDSDAADRSEAAIRAMHEAERIAEAMVFASAEPVSERLIAEKLPEAPISEW